MVRKSKLEISLTNCFGIGKLDCSFDILTDNIIMIYAPNGTMKTSLARTFYCLENNHGAADLIDDIKAASYSFLLDGNIVNSNQVYVYKTEDNQIEPNAISHLEEDNILSFVSSPILVKQFRKTLEPIERVISLINERFNKLVNRGKYFFQDEILKLFKHEGILAKYDSIIDAIMELKIFDTSDCDFAGVSFDELFDKYGVSEKYINKYYKELINANGDIRKKIKVSGSKRWKRLCELVDNNSYIKSRISDLEKLKKEYLLFFIGNELDIFLEFDTLYKKRKNQLENIIKKINTDTKSWNKVVSIFNRRFQVPYNVVLENKAEALINKDFLHLKYINKESRPYKGKEHFLNFISTGERRAYYLLVNLFEIEKRKKRNEEQIIVIDDIVESFDYKNKYAIVEYLADLKECKNFILIILTHNFDFYRTIHSRLGVKNAFIARRGENGVVSLEKGKYVRDILKNELIKNAHNTKYMIALIPFVRNIVEYTKGMNSSEYKSLTSYLHMFKDTKSLTLNDLYSIICSNILVEHNKKNDLCGNYYDELKKEVDKVLLSEDEISITNKLLLSISIRLQAEDFVRMSLPEQCINSIGSSERYTFLLFDEYKRTYPQDVKGCSVLTKVLMMTSENIHLNNFMFEPIIDLSIGHLKELHSEVTKLKNLYELSTNI